MLEHRMLKVLHMNDYMHGGGAEVFVHTLIAAQHNMGIEATLFTSENVRGYRRSWRNSVSSAACCAALHEELRQRSPDVVHLHNIYHALSPAILEVLRQHRKDRRFAVVMTAHDHHLLCPNSGLRCFIGDDWHMADVSRLQDWSYLLWRRWDHRGWLHSTMKLAQHLWHYQVHQRQRVIDCILAPSHFMAESLRKSDFRVEVVPNPAPPAMKRMKTSDQLQIVFAGRIEPEKGLAEFICELATFEHCELTVIGSGSALADCRHRAEQCGVSARVHFTGSMSHDKTLEIIGQSHLLALPSLAPETAGLVLLEALASGTNILTSNVGGPGEIVRESGVGYVFTPGDADSLRTALRRAAADFKRGCLNDFDVSEFLASRSVEVVARRIAAVYEQLLATEWSDSTQMKPRISTSE
jgi:glycosyltransferase involved in cell wall biosynthesis